MTRRVNPWLPLLAFVLALFPVVSTAQVNPPPFTPAAAQISAGARNELALDIGYVSAGVSYARRLPGRPVSLGAGLWGSWEPANSFDRTFWEPVGATVFGRYRPAEWIHADLGLAAARYLWADDCSECSGTFLGARAAGLLGYRYLFVGPEASLGRVTDERHGTDFGAAWGLQVRGVIGWGR